MGAVGDRYALTPSVKARSVARVVVSGFHSRFAMSAMSKARMFKIVRERALAEDLGEAAEGVTACSSIWKRAIGTFGKALRDVRSWRFGGDVGFAVVAGDGGGGADREADDRPASVAAVRYANAMRAT